MKLPEPSRGQLIAARLLLYLVATPITVFAQAQQLPEELEENWYRTELLIFVRDDALGTTTERWPPRPALAYPPEHRFFIDTRLADQRRDAVDAIASRVDLDGVQTVTVWPPLEGLLEPSREDWLLNEPFEPRRPDWLLQPPEALLADDAQALDPNTPVPGDPNAPGDALLEEELPGVEVVKALPYELLDDDMLEFRAQARTLRRRGHRVLFHGSWWATLPSVEESQALVIDRSGDPDTLQWPDFQGSVRLYLSRYLHVDLDLWLNTDGAYLPHPWQMESPPLAPASLRGETPDGEESNPWAPELTAQELLDQLPAAQRQAADPMASPAYTNQAETTEILADSSMDADREPVNVLRDNNVAGGDEPETDAQLVPYPWRHAVRFNEQRRMRSGEIHYLDHPVFGVIVRITPASAEALPIQPDSVIERRERHQLPVETLFIAETPEDIGG